MSDVRSGIGQFIPLTSVRERMKKDDLHCIFTAKQEKFKVWNAQGILQGTYPARGHGVNGPGYELLGGDTPPGLYELGDVVKTQSWDTPSIWRSYGPYFLDLIELDNQEAKRGRAGIGIHGGGSSLPAPLADYQGWTPTQGCIRMQNIDLVHFVHKFVEPHKTLKSKIYFNVVW